MLNYKEAGLRIRTRRIELGLTQEAVAEKINITPSFYSQIETGKRKASIKTFMNISQTLAISVDHILNNQPCEDLPSGFDEIDYKIYYRLRGLSHPQKQCLFEILCSLDKHFS